jgi:hypothetical protein
LLGEKRNNQWVNEDVSQVPVRGHEERLGIEATPLGITHSSLVTITTVTAAVHKLSGCETIAARKALYQD